MKIVAANHPQRLDSLVYEFTSKFPHLSKSGMALGRCKHYSMELVIFLRERGINAQLYTLSGITNKKAWPRANQEWKDTAPRNWAHYIVRVMDVAIDITSRQLDNRNPHPNIYPFAEVKEEWTSVKRDSFLTRIANEIRTARWVGCNQHPTNCWTWTMYVLVVLVFYILVRCPLGIR